MARKQRRRTANNRTAAEALTHDPRPFTTALDQAWRWWEDNAVLDDLDRDAVRDRILALTTACTDLGLTTLGDAFQRANHVITTAAKVESLILNRGPEAGHRVHRTRNTLSAVLWTLAWLDGHNPCSVIDDMPNITARPKAQGRRAYDDEILLLRLRAIYRLRRTRRYIAAGIMYALTEASIWPSETTHIRLGDFDNPRHPTTVTVSREACRADTDTRTVPLPRWAQKALPNALNKISETTTAQDYCVFQGTQENENNSASITATHALTRGMEEVGIDPTLKATEITYWRADRTRAKAGITLASIQIGWRPPDGDQKDKQATCRLDQALKRYNPPPKKKRQTGSFEGL